MSRFDPMMTSAANYYGGIANDLACSLLAIAAGFVVAGAGPALIAVGAGLVWYSFAEYATHRWLYHTGASFVAALHDRHHDEPDIIYGPPFYYSLAIAGAHGAIVAVFAGAAIALAFSGALLFGYVQQSIIHHATHRYPHLDVLGRRSRLRRHHAIHHTGAHANFGVSTTLWDRVFGTLR